MPNDDIWNLPQEVLEYLSNRHLRVNRMQYYLYNVKDIIVLCKYWWIIPMYVTTRIPCKSEPDHTNGKPKHTIDEVFDLRVSSSWNHGRHYRVPFRCCSSDKTK